ncbi:hypothetical protein KDA00_00485 [Candidatus Saccharibacteria bacterium]|nr:hypothetical protein [Candidatus Saccharibacteria bacterium]
MGSSPILGSKKVMENIVLIGMPGLVGLAEYRRSFYEAAADVIVELEGVDLEADYQRMSDAISDIL